MSLIRTTTFYICCFNVAVACFLASTSLMATTGAEHGGSTGPSGPGGGRHACFGRVEACAAEDLSRKAETANLLVNADLGKQRFFQGRRRELEGEMDSNQKAIEDLQKRIRDLEKDRNEVANRKPPPNASKDPNQDQGQGGPQDGGQGGPSAGNNKNDKGDNKLEPGKISFPEMGNNAMDSLLGVGKLDDVKPPSEYLTYQEGGPIQGPALDTSPYKNLDIEGVPRNVAGRGNKFNFSPGNVASGRIGDLLGKGQPGSPLSGDKGAPPDGGAPGKGEGSAPGIGGKGGGGGMDDGVFKGIGEDTNSGPGARSTFARKVDYGEGTTGGDGNTNDEANSILAKAGGLNIEGGAGLGLAGAGINPAPRASGKSTGKGIMALVGTFGSKCFKASEMTKAGYCQGHFSLKGRIGGGDRSPASVGDVVAAKTGYSRDDRAGNRAFSSGK